MGIEIERKYLVDMTLLERLGCGDGIHLVQGYLNSDKDRTVRIRTVQNDPSTNRIIGGYPEDKGYITVKSASEGIEGITRSEYEYAIPLRDAKEMLAMCPKTLSKTRYRMQYMNVILEIDFFEGDLDGLVICEVELRNENQEFTPPAMLAKEVSDDPRYFNSNLINYRFEHGELIDKIDKASEGNGCRPNA